MRRDVHTLCPYCGVACGLISGVLTRALYGLEDAFGRLPLHWMWWPAVGAVVVGLGDSEPE